MTTVTDSVPLWVVYWRKTQQTLRREEWSGDSDRTRVSVKPDEQPQEWPTRWTKKEGGYITKQTPWYLQRVICQLFLLELPCTIGCAT